MTEIQIDQKVVQDVSSAIVECAAEFKIGHYEVFAALQVAAATWVESYEIKPSEQMVIISELTPFFEALAQVRKERKAKATGLN